MLYNLIVAYDLKFGIGHSGGIPWFLPGDLKRFKALTTQPLKNCVIMGRKTWESLPDKYKPLPGRFNIVLSTQPPPENFASEMENSLDHVRWCKTWDQVDFIVNQLPNLQEAFIMGGGQIYKQAMTRYTIHTYYLTQALNTYPSDTFFHLPNFKYYNLIESQVVASSETRDPVSDTNKHPHYRMQIWQRQNPILTQINKEEQQYQTLLKTVLERGKYSLDRTEVGTLGLFEGCQLKFDLTDSFPIMTTKRVYWKGVVKELMLFLSGKTDVRILQADNVHIWDGNTSREYLDKIGQIHRKEGDLGKFYGFQWRHWNAEYTDCDQDYTGQGLDQIAQMVDLIKTDPRSRRILLTGWNPSDLKETCLPPCHVLYQFYVDPDDQTLCCSMYMRSNDLFLGNPFNVASTALLTCLIAKTCDLNPGRIIITLGDAHIYLNHISQVLEQLSRVPTPFPQLNIKTKRNQLEDYVMEDLELLNYHPQAIIKAEMAV